MEPGEPSPMLSSVGEIRGFLRAFEEINSKSDHGYTFSLATVPRKGTLLESLQLHYGAEASLGLCGLSDWESHLTCVLNKWLFAMFDDDHYCLVDPRDVFTLYREDLGFRQPLIRQIVDAFQLVLQPVAAWSVDVQMTSWYECDWDDIAIEGKVSLFLLHLGVSD